MRATIGIVYWLVVGLLVLNALYVSVAESRLWWSGALVPAALALLGAWWPGLGYSGAGLVVVGAYPALFITRFVLDQIFSMDWSCSTVAFDGISNPNGGTAGCTTVSIDLILFMLVLWTIALLGAALLYRQPRPRGA
jgi:hypothetical protein